MSTPPDIDMSKPYARHIVVDCYRKVIYIEVQKALTGNPKIKELQDLEAGQWWDYVPANYTDSIRGALGNGYTLMPMVNDGLKNERFYIIQVLPISTKGGTDHHLILPQ